MKENPEFEKAVASLDTILKPDYDHIKKLRDGVDKEETSESVMSFITKYQELYNTKVSDISQAVKTIASSMGYTFDEKAFQEKYRV